MNTFDEKLYKEKFGLIQLTSFYGDAKNLECDCMINVKGKAKHFLHINVPYFGHKNSNIAELVDCYLKAFRFAAEREASNLAMPLLGTGNTGWKATDSLEAFKTALIEFWKNWKSNHSKMLNIIIFTNSKEQESMISSLCDSPMNVFLLAPPHWSARGEEVLWSYLMDRFFDKKIKTVTEFIDQFMKEFSELTINGKKGDLHGHIFQYIESMNTGGMSGGIIEHDFFFKLALPLLCERFYQSCRYYEYGVTWEHTFTLRWENRRFEIALPEEDYDTLKKIMIEMTRVKTE